jgi:quinone-modifying oxidoreductase subunit QmoA
VKEQLPEAEVTVYYIDRRTPGRGEDLLTRMTGTDGVRLVKGKVGKVEQGSDGGLVLKLEDVESGRLEEAHADLVVLATGMVPNVGDDLPFGLKTDEDGFALDDLPAGITVAGVARRPQDVVASVRDATGAAARAWMSAEEAR